MTAKRTHTPLGDMCDSERGITYGIVKVGDFIPGGVPVIRGGDIRNGRIVFDDEKRVTEEISRQFQRTILRGGEIVINLIAEPGHTAIVPPQLVGANVSRDVGVIPLDDTVDHRYVDYCLKSPMAIQWLTSRLQGSVTQKINLGILRELPIPTPPLSEQRAIAHILGTLDDKIELNRRQNETLEAMARALFKSWFVDFDPVRAKAEGHDTGLPGHIADLFPDAFEDSELGKIPKGWAVKPIGDFIERLSVGKKYEQKTVAPFGKIPVLDQGKSGVIGYHSDAPGVIASADAPVVVFANHTCNMRLVSFSFSAIQNVLPFVGKGIDTVWVFYATLGKQTFIEYKGHWPDFIIQNIVIPDPKLSVMFAKAIHPILKQIWMTENECLTLSTLRDSLLPKLLSGEMRIHESTPASEGLP